MGFGICWEHYSITSHPRNAVTTSTTADTTLHHCEKGTKEQFIKNGWTEVSQDQLGGALINHDVKEQVVFMKQVKRSEKYRLRCNKYEPPHLIVLSER